jgi:formate-dependent nitrite reductase membrane component NrfD
MESGYERSWENRRAAGRSVSDESRSSYYGLPVIHRAHWKWEIYTYFFLGGISGASYVIASFVQWLGGRGAERIERTGRYLSFAALLPSPVLLILDLGRPDRFHHMLRVVKLRSPMSVGTWGLMLFSAFSALSALIQAARDGLFGRGTWLARLLLVLPARLIGGAGLFPAFFLSGYTGVLLSATAVPLWARNYLLLGPLFITSSLSSAAAALTLLFSLARKPDHAAMKRLERLDLVAMLAEAALLVALRANLTRIAARPLTEGRMGMIYRVGVLGAGVTAPLALQVLGTRAGARFTRTLDLTGAILTLVGGFLLRYVMVMGGRISADDPEATFEMTRQSGQER